MITSYKGEDTQVVVPGFVAGLPVKVLGEFSFSAIQPYIKYEIKKRRAKIESVVISEGVEVIEKDCFRNTERITTLVLPHSLKEFKAEEPYLVKTLVIPENVIEVWVYDVYKRYLTELTFLGPTKIKDLYEDYLYPSYSELKVVKGLPNSDAAILAKRTKATFIPLDGK